MVLHSLARDRSCRSAALDPLAAAVRMDRQSVLILGENGVLDKTTSMAHSSAAAAVATLLGGDPYPYPINSPSLDTTAMPMPVARRSTCPPLIRLPSQYHVAVFGSVWLEAGSSNHLNEPQGLWIGAGSLRATTPRSWSSWKLSSLILC